MPDQVFTPGQILTAAQLQALQVNSAMAPMTPSSVTNGSASGAVVTATGGLASISVNGVFTSGFVNYKIIVTNLTTTASVDLRTTLSASAGASYKSVLSYYDYALTTAVNIPQNLVATGFQQCFASSTYNSCEFELFNPFLATVTTMRGSGTRVDNPIITMGYDTNPASHTGFTLTASTGTITTATIRVYGIR